MKKNNKYLFAGAFVVIGVGAFLIYRFATKSKSVGGVVSEQKPNETSTGSAGSSTSTGTTASTPSSLASTSFPLKNGSKGSQVQVLQKWLNDKGYSSPKLVEDGVFGVKTETAVKSMQNRAFEKSISDYLIDSAFAGTYKLGQVSKDFYDIFITKTKTATAVSPSPFGTPSSTPVRASSSSAFIPNPSSSQFYNSRPFG